MTEEHEPRAGAEPAEEPARDTEEPTAAPPGDKSAREDGDADNEDTQAVRARQSAYTTINGNIRAEHAVFGVFNGHAERPHRVTGTIKASEVERQLRHYQVPERFGDAEAVLRGCHVVALSGLEGIGKRTTAIKLLVDLGCSRLTSVSPALALSQVLNTVTFERGQGYLICDHVGDGSEAGVHVHDLELLSARVEKAGAHLVVTGTPPFLVERALPDFAVRITAPDHRALLLRCLEGADLAPGVEARALDSVARLRRPREVVRLAAGLREDPERALDALQHTARDQVDRWLDGEPTTEDVFSVATLALIGPQPQPTHELLHQLLLGHTRPAPAEGAAAPGPLPGEWAVKRRNRSHELMTAEADEADGSGSGRQIRFRSPELREITLAALHEEFGYSLWEPVRRFLRGLAALDLRIEIEGGIAYGLARLALADFTDVRLGLLEHWAGGRAGERSTAAMVLWFMGDDDHLAPLALRTAFEWGSGRGLPHAITSAMALGGPLGLRYPVESMRRLCFLALRAKRIAAVARTSLQFLFATAVKEGSENADEVLLLVGEEHRRAITKDRGTGAAEAPGAPEVDGSDEQYEHGWSHRVVRAARSMVVSVLSTTQPDSGDPATAQILRFSAEQVVSVGEGTDQPDGVTLLGGLWADVLCSAPHRAEAIEALCRTLRALEGDRSAHTAVARLGAVINQRMPPAHRALRLAELVRAMESDRFGRRPPKVLVSTLLAAIGGEVAPTTSTPSS